MSLNIDEFRVDRDLSLEELSKVLRLDFSALSHLSQAEIQKIQDVIFEYQRSG